MLTMINEPGKGAPKNIQFLVGDSAPGLTLSFLNRLFNFLDKMVLKIANREGQVGRKIRVIQTSAAALFVGRPYFVHD